MQGIEYHTAMDCLQKADRRSLLAEIEDLRAQINGGKMTLEREQGTEKSSQGVCMPGSSDPIAVRACQARLTP